MLINGTVKYQNLSTGFWSIIGNDGRKWRPVNMPSEISKEGLLVEVQAEQAQEVVSVFMWGTPVTIKSFKLL
jgi:hypothetical protein